MSRDLSLPIVTAVLGLLTAGVLALINNWINARSGRDENLRLLRLKQYPDLWACTATVARWPRAPVDRGTLGGLQQILHTWYYGQGGLYLSDRSAARYGDFQELITALLAVGTDRADSDVLTPNAYTDVMETGGALRVALMDDLETRRRSAWARSRQSHWHAQRARATSATVSEVKGGGGPTFWQRAMADEATGGVQGTRSPM